MKYKGKKRKREKKKKKEKKNPCIVYLLAIINNVKFQILYQLLIMSSCKASDLKYTTYVCRNTFLFGYQIKHFWSSQII